MGVGDVDGRGAGGDGDGDEAVVALLVSGDCGAVEGDVPAWIVTEVEDEVFGDGGVELEMAWGGAGLGGGWGLCVGVS